MARISRNQTVQIDINVAECRMVDLLDQLDTGHTLAFTKIDGDIIEVTLVGGSSRLDERFSLKLLRDHWVYGPGNALMFTINRLINRFTRLLNG